MTYAKQIVNNPLVTVSPIRPREDLLLDALEKDLYDALNTYSNVHRGSGHASLVSTELFERARRVILDYLHLDERKYVVIFCSPRRAENLTKRLPHKRYSVLSSANIGLAVGVRAVAVEKKALPMGIPAETGGGTAKLVSTRWIIWAAAPDRFEAGTPALINVVAFAKGLQLLAETGAVDFLQDEVKDENRIIHDTNTANSIAQNILYEDTLRASGGTELLEELRSLWIGKNLSVPTMEGERPFINFDNSASTPTFSPIWDAFRHTLRWGPLVQQQVVEEVRGICSTMLHAPLDTYDILFSSNTTEATNLAAQNLKLSYEDDEEPVVVSSLLEHSSNDLPWRGLANTEVIRLSVDENGFLNLEELESLLEEYNSQEIYGNKRIKLIAVSGASNVLGTCNDMKTIAQLAHQYGAKLLVDGAQLVAHRKIDMDSHDIDYLTFSAHKMYAPFGSGALVVKKDLLNFSDTELAGIHRSGNENAAGIAALGKAGDLLQRIGMDHIAAHEHMLAQRALLGLANITGVRVHGIADSRSPLLAQKVGVIVFEMKTGMADKVAKDLAARGGIGIRWGCHCAHVIVKRVLGVGRGLEGFQRVIQTLFPKIKLPGVARVSFGIENTVEEVDALIEVLEQIANRSTVQTPNPPSKSQFAQQMTDFSHATANRIFP